MSFALTCARWLMCRWVFCLIFRSTVALTFPRRTGPLLQRGRGTEAVPQDAASGVELQGQLCKSAARERIAPSLLLRPLTRACRVFAFRVKRHHKEGSGSTLPWGNRTLRPV